MIRILSFDEESSLPQLDHLSLIILELTLQISNLIHASLAHSRSRRGRGRGAGFVGAGPGLVGVGVGVGVVGESGLGAGSAVTGLGRTGGVVKVLRYAVMMIRALREITMRRGRTLVVGTAGCPSCLSSYLSLQVAEVSFG